MNRKDVLDRFCLNQHTIFHQHIKPQRLLAEKAFVANADDPLICGDEFPQFEFSHQTPLVDRFDESWSFVTMNFDCRGNDVLGQVRSLAEKRVHPLSLSAPFTPVK